MQHSISQSSQKRTLPRSMLSWPENLQTNLGSQSNSNRPRSYPILTEECANLRSSCPHSNNIVGTDLSLLPIWHHWHGMSHVCLGTHDVANGSGRCELQFDYGLRQKRFKPLANRPNSFVSAEGKQILVQKDVAAVNDDTTKRGKVKSIPQKIRTHFTAIPGCSQGTRTSSSP